jgi:hypothetical protein
LKFSALMLLSAAAMAFISVLSIAWTLEVIKSRVHKVSIMDWMDDKEYRKKHEEVITTNACVQAIRRKSVLEACKQCVLTSLHNQLHQGLKTE